jgi:predicted protein tyrosine phosphatase
MPPAALDPAARFLTRLRLPVRPRLVPSALRGGAFGLLLAAAVEVGGVAFDSNLHAVQPGRVYRSAQMMPDRLRRVLERHGIRGVVNLRGCCAEFPWYCDEARVSHDLGVSQEDVCLSAIRLPSPSEIRRLIDVLDRTEHPILLHCRQGVDRTGLAAVAVKLLEPGVSLAEARRQLSICYGYVPFNGTENMDRFFDLYAEWLRSIDCAHSPDLFRHWATARYCPGACRGAIEPTADFPSDGRLAARRIHRLGVNARNTSVREWRLRAGTAQGIYIRYSVVAEAGGTAFSERAGLFDATVAPGETIVLTLGIPALPPGNYSLQAELCEGEANSFTQFGVEPFAWPFRVEP